MEAEDWHPSEQMQCNTGVIFFRKEPLVDDVFKCWRELADKYREEWCNDQPHFTLAMEQCGFNPFTLSINWNYRGFGGYVSGKIVIWHSHYLPPQDINEFGSAWPPRRVWPGQVLDPVMTEEKTFQPHWRYQRRE